MMEGPAATCTWHPRVLIGSWVVLSGRYVIIIHHSYPDYTRIVSHIPTEMHSQVEPEAAPVPDSGCGCSGSGTTGAVVWPSAVCRASCLKASECRSNRTVIAGEHCGGRYFVYSWAKLATCCAVVADSAVLQVMPAKKASGSPINPLTRQYYIYIYVCVCV